MLIVGKVCREICRINQLEIGYQTADYYDDPHEYFSAAKPNFGTTQDVHDYGHGDHEKEDKLCQYKNLLQVALFCLELCLLKVKYLTLVISLHLDQPLYFVPLEDLYRERKDKRIGIEPERQLLNDEDC